MTRVTQHAQGGKQHPVRLNIKLEPKLHQKLRVLVAQQGTTIQKWIVEQVRKA